MSSSTAAAASSALQPAQLWKLLHELVPAPVPTPLRCAVAWSGGLDSTVLLHLMLELRRRHARQLRLRAIHVDHHLQAASAAFRAHCQRLARRWRVGLTLLDASVEAARGASVEEAAREARYACWRAALEPGELLLSAQHADDQLETTLLALLRGAGPAGLAAMPAIAPLGSGHLLRPLLGFRRADLASYATARQLPVVEDPSNAQSRFDRNFLRLQVTPLLRQRWPGAASTVSRSARHCAVAAALQAARGAADLELAADGPDLDLTVLRRWPGHRLFDVLRAWFARHGLRSPETRHLREIQQMLDARSDAHPHLDLPQVRVRLHAGRLLMQPMSALLPPRPPEPLAWAWRRGPLRLPDGGTLAVLPDIHGDMDMAELPPRLTVYFLQGLHTRRRSLRKLLQELQVPLWERSRLPLLYPADGAAGEPAAGEPVAVGDLWLHRRVQQHGGTRRRGRIVWRVTG